MRVRLWKLERNETFPENGGKRICFLPALSLHMSKSIWSRSGVERNERKCHLEGNESIREPGMEQEPASPLHVLFTTRDHLTTRGLDEWMDGDLKPIGKTRLDTSSSHRRHQQRHCISESAFHSNGKRFLGTTSQRNKRFH